MQPRDAPRLRRFRRRMRDELEDRLCYRQVRPSPTGSEPSNRNAKTCVIQSVPFWPILCYIPGMAHSMRGVTVERLIRAGAPAELVETLRALLSVRQDRPRNPAAPPCLACGRSPQGNGDYLCGSCSTLKSRNERKFWQRVNETGHAGAFPACGPIVTGDDPKGDDNG